MPEPEEIGQEGLQVEMTCNSEGSGEEGSWKGLGLFENRQKWAVHESSEEGQCPEY